MTDRTYSAAEINAVAGTGWCYWRLEYFIRQGKVVPLNRGSGRERRFSAAEAVTAVNLLRPEEKSSLEQLEELANER